MISCPSFPETWKNRKTLIPFPFVPCSPDFAFTLFTCLGVPFDRRLSLVTLLLPYAHRKREATRERRIVRRRRAGKAPKSERGTLRVYTLYNFKKDCQQIVCTTASRVYEFVSLKIHNKSTKNIQLWPVLHAISHSLSHSFQNLTREEADWHTSTRPTD